MPSVRFHFVLRRSDGSQRVWNAAFTDGLKRRKKRLAGFKNSSSPSLKGRESQNLSVLAFLFDLLAWIQIFYKEYAMKRFFAVITALFVITFSGCMELFDKNDSSASYTVECYRQNADNSDYALQPEETSVQGGIAGRMTGVIAKPLTGFTAKTVSQKKIRSDGSTVVKLYYDRKIVTLTFNSDGGSSVASISGKYGAAVPTVPAPAKSGYTFGGWMPAIPTEFPADNATYTAKWKTAAYKITGLKYKKVGFSSTDNSYEIAPSEYTNKIASVWFNGKKGSKEDYYYSVHPPKGADAYHIRTGYNLIYFSPLLQKDTIVELKDADGNVLGSFNCEGIQTDFTQNN